jgi:hypothetical protein
LIGHFVASLDQCVTPLLGKRRVNIDPLPSSLVTVTSPPIMRASLREMARPSPVPPYCRAVEEAAPSPPVSRAMLDKAARLAPGNGCAMLDARDRDRPARR